MLGIFLRAAVMTAVFKAGVSCLALHSDRVWSTFILKLASFSFSSNLLQLGSGSKIGLFLSKALAVLGLMRCFTLMAV